MALLGFDALGQLALGELPSGIPVYYQQLGPSYYRVRFNSNQPTAPLNINLFTNPYPFNQFDWSKPIRLPLALPQPPYSLNLNLFKNPIPNNQFDWAKPTRVPRAPFDLSVSLNPNLQKNPIPNNQTDWSKGFSLKPLPTPPQPYSLALYAITIVANPFNQTDWPKPTNIRALPLPSNPLNINLFTNPFPLNQTDWSKPIHLPLALPQPAIGININVYTNPYPFNQYDYPRPFDLRGSIDQSQPYNPNLYSVVVISTPFNQTDWSVPQRVKVATPLPDTLNINLFTNPVPFIQGFVPPAIRQRALPDVPQPLNLNLIPSAPFNQTYWPKPAPQSFNIALPINNPNLTIPAPLPFNQFDFFASRRIPRALADLSQSLNPNLIVIPSQAPIFNLFSAPIYKLRPSPPDNSIGFQILTIPPPVGGAPPQRTLVGTGT